jgi:hypothetical protein
MMTSGLAESMTDDPALASNEVQVSNWAALAGRWEFKPDIARYEGMASHPGPTSESPYGLARCGINLQDGIVRCAITLSRNEKTSAGIVLGFQSLSQPYALVQLGAWGRAYSLGEHIPSYGWSELSGAGSIGNLSPNTPYDVEVDVRGQRVRVKVNKVDVLDSVLRMPLSAGGIGLFAWDSASVEFSNVRVDKTQVRVFVVMPFREPFDTLYHDVIRPVVEDADMIPQRVDEISGPGIILDDIRQQIEESHVVIAEVSTPNPNVFYELGYAHALNKPAILLARREPDKDLPFDIQGYRAIFYDDSIGGKKQVEAHLRKHLDAIRRDS